MGGATLSVVEGVVVAGLAGKTGGPAFLRGDNGGGGEDVWLESPPRIKQSQKECWRGLCYGRDVPRNSGSSDIITE